MRKLLQFYFANGELSPEYWSVDLPIVTPRGIGAYQFFLVKIDYENGDRRIRIGRFDFHHLRDKVDLYYANGRHEYFSGISGASCVPLNEQPASYLEVCFNDQYGPVEVSGDNFIVAYSETLGPVEEY